MPLVVSAQNSAINQVVAVAPFLNGALPSRRPLDPDSTEWTVSPTFTGIDADLTLVPGAVTQRVN